MGRGLLGREGSGTRGHYSSFWMERGAARGHKALHTCTSWYAHAAIFGIRAGEGGG